MRENSRYAVLGLLGMGAVSGYDIKKKLPAISGTGVTAKFTRFSNDWPIRNWPPGRLKNKRANRIDISIP